MKVIFYTKKQLQKRLWCTLFFISSSLLPLSSTENTITITKSITFNQTLISEGGKFALGFFTPNNSTSQYLGIWYNTIPKLTTIWIANRASPIPENQNSPPVFRLSDNGNLVVLTGRRIIWTSNVSGIGLDIKTANAVLFDNGNLVLKHGEQEVWRSFDHPSDTFIPGMRLSSNRKSGQKMLLTSSITDEDPRPGRFSIGVDPDRYELYIWKDDKPFWRSNVYAAPFSFASGLVKYGQSFSAYLSFIIEDDDVYVVYSVSSDSVTTRFTLVPNGRLQLSVWVNTAWRVAFQAPLVTCDLYGYCGPFATCQKDEAKCTCLTGFDPKLPEEWSLGNWSGGCVRSKELGCDRDDTFFKYEGLKLPDYAVNTGNKSVIECADECFRNCSCLAYAYQNITYAVTVACLNWFSELVDIATNASVSHDLFVRVHNSAFDQHVAGDDSEEQTPINIKKPLVAVAVAIVSTGLLLISVFGYLWRRKRLKRKERIKKELVAFDSMSTASMDTHNSAELVSFSLKSVLAATASFSVKNKLGEGGFGPVYKGSFPGNRQVAVKRLSTRSSQGREEFMNELKLIAKLQHTNLVRLLGCCVEEDEKILIYEYMPNRSLDRFIFDPSESVNLDGSQRLKIIEGIAQGLLYLHKYSRLRVIHRDLKASNVLLDETMTPKISDFGLARIFEMNQIEDKTNRVVGTYGYMAPEYALHGRFSEKSDVFSFGVLLLEIVTGRRNSGCDCQEDALTVFEWAWENSMEGRAIDLIDPSMRNTCDPLQAVKCINIGLLCVQESMDERPTMSEVVVMLSNESVAVPLPKPPAFTIHRRSQVLKRIKKELVAFDSMSTASMDTHNSAELVSFSLKSVLAATASFSVKNKLGEGGFGPVYKGSFPGNRQVAIKRLSTRSSQGREEFMNELKLIAKLQHTNLVRLLGCCVEEDEKILIYEYMPNRSLDRFIFDPSESVHLDGSQRLKIIEGIAQGLLYLHKYSRLRVIHRDLKASNVLLDETMTPKISDFGLARIFEMNQIEDKTNRVVGTYGYMAPEYALHGRFSEKSDVFSFGVLLLEIVTGRRNSGSDCQEDALTVSEWAWENSMEGRGVDLIDPAMRNTCDPLQAVKCINIGLLCVQESMDERPTMSEVVVMLSNESVAVPLPKPPAFTIHRRSQVLSSYSNNEVTMTNVEAR